MSLIEDQVRQIEQNIKEAQKIKDLGDALARLMTNRDFKKVIQEGYFEKEAVRLVHLKADTSMQSDDSQKSILTQIDGIGNLSQYLRTVEHLGRMAAKSIASDEAELAEIREGDAE